MSADPSAGYFDESRVDGRWPFPIVAGFWSVVELWIVCEQQLLRALRNKPARLEAKKYIRGNAVEFAGILSNTLIVPIYSTIELSVFRHLLHKGKKRDADFFASAYTVCSYAVCELLDETARQKKWKKPVEVVFDDGSEYKTLFDRGYRKYYANKPHSHLSSAPIFKRDREKVVLLAADLYAWLLSKKYNETLNVDEEEALTMLHQYKPVHAELTRERLQRIGWKA